MKLVHTEVSGTIIIEKKTFTEWIIESPDLFSKYVQELYVQCERKEGQFVLSDNDKELDMSKCVEIIGNPFMVDINSRKILGKLYAELEELSRKEQMFEKTMRLTSTVHEYILNLEQETNYILQFDNELEISALLKALGVRHEEIEDSFFERIVRYIKIAADVLKTKLFVFVNIRSFLSDIQMMELVKEISYQDIKVLFIENQERDCLEGGFRYIIDKDGCEIY